MVISGIKGIATNRCPHFIHLTLVRVFILEFLLRKLYDEDTYIVDSNKPFHQKKNYEFLGDMFYNDMYYFFNE